MQLVLSCNELTLFVDNFFHGKSFAFNLLLLSVASALPSDFRLKWIAQSHSYARSYSFNKQLSEFYFAVRIPFAIISYLCNTADSSGILLKLTSSWMLTERASSCRLLA